MLETLEITLPLFALIACGYGAGKLGLLGEPGVAGLNLFVFYFALPAMLFRAMALRPLEEILNGPFMVAWAAAALFVLLAVLLAARVFFGAGLGEAAMLALAGEFSNAGYLGIPLVIALLGEAAAVPIALTIAVDLLFSLSLVIVLVEWSRRGDGGLGRALWTVGRAAGLNPFVLSIVAGVAVAWLRLPLPGAIDRFTALFAAAAPPGALFALGATLGVRPFTRAAGALALGVGAKLVLHPVAVLVTTVFLFRVDPFWALVALLNAGIPSASNVYVLAQRYGLYVDEVSATILLSTAIAVVSFVGWTRLLGL